MNQREFWRDSRFSINIELRPILILVLLQIFAGCSKPVEKNHSAGSKESLSKLSGDDFSDHSQLTATGEKKSEKKISSAIRFQNTAEPSGLRIHHYSAAHGQFRLIETMGSGVGLVDFDADGHMDILICQGSEIPVDTSESNPEKGTQLYRNKGDGAFENVTAKAGLRFSGFAQGTAVGDYDGDGDDDIFISGFQKSALFENQGNGTFRDVTSQAGLVQSGWATSCAFADFDRDGDLDLYVVRYLADTVDSDGRPTVTCNALPGQIGYCPPLAHRSEPDSLYRNNGDGTFTDIGAEIGLSEMDGNGLGLAIADFDDDGNLDIFVANDKTPCRYYHNLGNMKFEESGLINGLAYNESGEPTAAMGVAVGDADDDGWLDILVTNFYEEGVTFFRNLGKGRFEVATSRTRLKIPTRSQLGFGTGFHDFDNDGNLDLFMTNGHVNDVRPLRMPYQMKPQLFQNQGDGRFQDISNLVGPYFQEKWLGRAAAFGDLNNDGRMDILVTHNEGPPALLINQADDNQQNHVLRLQLVPAQKAGKSVSPIGSMVRVRLENGRTLLRCLSAGTSYLSSHDSRLLVGIGDEKQADLEIRWPDGRSETFAGQPADQPLLLRQSLQ